MTAAKAHRGRPKGSGIDDQIKLVEIARIISRDPRLKPTTAIKAIGVTDPSTIRRLRDKFNSKQSELMARAAARPSATVTPMPVAAQPAVHRASPLKIAEPTRRADPLPPFEMGHGLAALLPAKAGKSENMPMAALLFGFGLNAATAIFEQQMMLAQSLMKIPPVRDLVRNQIALTEFMLSVARPSPGSRLTH
jgi:hypothetical protein